MVEVEFIKYYLDFYLYSKNNIKNKNKKSCDVLTLSLFIFLGQDQEKQNTANMRRAGSKPHTFVAG